MTKPFVPLGYIWTPEAVARAAQKWFRAELKACDPGEAPKVDPSGDPLRDAMVAAVVSQNFALRRDQILEDRVKPILLEVSSRIRGALFDGRLCAVYSSRLQRKLVSIDQGFWATTDADFVIERGWFQLINNVERGNKLIEYPVYVSDLALNALLADTEQQLSISNGTSEAPPLQRRRGSKPKLREAVKSKMRALIAREGWPALELMTEEAMLATFGAKSRDTCRKAREELSTEMATKQRQTPTIDN